MNDLLNTCGSQYEWQNNNKSAFQKNTAAEKRQYDLNYDEIQKQSKVKKNLYEQKATALSESIKNWKLEEEAWLLSENDLDAINRIMKKSGWADNYRRTQLEFRWLSEEQMKEQYYESWNTREEVLSWYKKQYELYENSLNLVKKLSNTELSINEDTEIFMFILNQIKKELSYNIDSSNRLKNFWKDASNFESNISNLENIIKKLNNIAANI